MLSDDLDIFRTLEGMHMTRMSFVVNEIASFYSSYNNLRVLDIGCGIGLVAESMARLGANVTALDPSPDHINRAKQRCSLLTIEWHEASIESWGIEDGTVDIFDIVIALEVIEHCSDTSQFVGSCVKYLRPGGLLFISTINKNLLSLLIAKFGAEYIANIVPRGTHDWHNFISPGDLGLLLRSQRLDILNIKGMMPTCGGWKIADKPLINYILSAIKT